MAQWLYYCICNRKVQVSIFFSTLIFKCFEVNLILGFKNRNRHFLNKLWKFSKYYRDRIASYCLEFIWKSQQSYYGIYINFMSNFRAWNYIVFWNQPIYFKFGLFDIKLKLWYSIYTWYFCWFSSVDENFYRLHYKYIFSTE